MLCVKHLEMYIVNYDIIEFDDKDNEVYKFSQIMVKSLQKTRMLVVDSNITLIPS